MKKTFLLLTGILAWTAQSATAEEEQGIISATRYSDTRINIQPTTVPGTAQLNLARPGADISPPLLSDFGFGTENSLHLSPTRPTDTQTQLNFRNDWAISAPEDNDGSGLYLSPRYTAFSSNDAGFEGYSAEIRFGNVVQFERGEATSGWYVFAAADGEALSVSTNNFSLSDGAPMTMSLDDQITIGDLQAGVSTYFGGTQFTISYIETEASYSAPGGISHSERESFAGFSLAREF
ncbi:hypothetical protein [Ponticaulis sp.]|uniref:hypothetical protein n=1 Tax=Ponticaulis sp. TaxID=2020902 RepID=UPI000C3AD408|nr:hypothetical protein [Ponticaulis sp.]MAJ08557.1 hypothetical protein [Ponticaulis sp.]|tara:strand:+ start:475 stop:1182 length:708 start_codon:yes stop_codon:yes gene_type:complete